MDVDCGIVVNLYVVYLVKPHYHLISSNPKGLIMFSSEIRE